MKRGPLKEGRKWNKQLAPYRPTTFEKWNLSLKKQEDFPPSTACEKENTGQRPERWYRQAADKE